MMKTIEIDDDIYAHLKASVADFGETPTDVLRRLLKVSHVSTSAPTAAEDSELQKLLKSSDFTYAKGVVGRFLVILRWLHDQEPAAFAKVLSIRGRDRLYFAKDKAILDASGSNVNAKPIPGTEYWVITTTPTILKQEILQQVMRVLGCDPADIKTAKSAIAY